MTEVLGGVLARAARHARVELCGFVAASSHVHLLCRARDGELSKFMQYFLGNVSRKAGRLVHWRGSFWERRFSAQQVLDAVALEDRLKYILAHGVKEGLVRKVEEWPGLSCVSQLLGESKRSFRFYEWAKRWKSGKLKPGGGLRWSPEWSTKEELELHPLEHWLQWTPEQRRARVRQLIAEVEAEGRSKHRRVRGRDRVIATHPHTMQTERERRRRPWCHASSGELRESYVRKYKAFVRAFADAVKRLRAGKTLKEAEFPPFSFAPFIVVRV